MQQNLSYEESPFLSQNPEEIYDEVQDTMLSPQTSDDLQYPAGILIRKRRHRGKKRRRVKYVCFAGLASFAVLCVVALLVAVVFYVVKLEAVNTELRQLQEKLNNQSSLMSIQRQLDRIWMEQMINRTGRELEHQLSNLSVLQSSMFNEMNTQRQEDKARINSMMNATGKGLVDLRTQIDNLTGNYQKLLRLHQISCIEKQRVCDINARSVGLSAQYYWTHCSTDMIFINRTVSLFPYVKYRISSNRMRTSNRTRPRIECAVYLM